MNSDLAAAIRRLIAAADRNDIEDTKFSWNAWQREKAAGLALAESLEAGQPWLRTHDGHDVGDPDWESRRESS